MSTEPAKEGPLEAKQIFEVPSEDIETGTTISSSQDDTPGSPRGTSTRMATTTQHASRPRAYTLGCRDAEEIKKDGAGLVHTMLDLPETADLTVPTTNIAPWATTIREESEQSLQRRRRGRYDLNISADDSSLNSFEERKRTDADTPDNNYITDGLLSPNPVDAPHPKPDVRNLKTAGDRPGAQAQPAKPPRMGVDVNQGISPMGYSDAIHMPPLSSIPLGSLPPGAVPLGVHMVYPTFSSSHDRPSPTTNLFSTSHRTRQLGDDGSDSVRGAGLAKTSAPSCSNLQLEVNPDASHETLESLQSDQLDAVSTVETPLSPVLDSVTDYGPGRVGVLRRRKSEVWSSIDSIWFRMQRRIGALINWTEGRHSEFGRFLASVLITALTMCFVVVVNIIAHMRYPQASPPLPDLLHDLLPDLSSEPWMHLPDYIMCIHTLMLVVTVARHKRKLLVLRRTLVIYSLIMMVRAICILSTSLPEPCLHCRPECKVYTPTGIFDHLYNVFTGVFPFTTSCGDYMFSGHTVYMTICSLIYSNYPSKRSADTDKVTAPAEPKLNNSFENFILNSESSPLPRVLIPLLSVAKFISQLIKSVSNLKGAHWLIPRLHWALTYVGLLSIVVTRLHYTIDVSIALIITVAFWEFYHAQTERQILRHRQRIRDANKAANRHDYRSFDHMAPPPQRAMPGSTSQTATESGSRRSLKQQRTSQGGSSDDSTVYARAKESTSVRPKRTPPRPALNSQLFVTSSSSDFEFDSDTEDATGSNSSMDVKKPSSSRDSMHLGVKPHRAYQPRGISPQSLQRQPVTKAESNNDAAVSSGDETETPASRTPPKFSEDSLRMSSRSSVEPATVSGGIPSAQAVAYLYYAYPYREGMDAQASSAAALPEHRSHTEKRKRGLPSYVEYGQRSDPAATTSPTRTPLTKPRSDGVDPDLVPLGQSALGLSVTPSSTISYRIAAVPIRWERTSSQPIDTESIADTASDAGSLAQSTYTQLYRFAIASQAAYDSELAHYDPPPLSVYGMLDFSLSALFEPPSPALSSSTHRSHRLQANPNPLSLGGGRL